MNFNNIPWSIKKIVRMKDNIDPKPQYQRGPVWRTPKKQLLIDSIINRFDIPKIYLRRIKGMSPYDYEVADGQQRLIAVWGFINQEYPLGSVRGDNDGWSGKVYSELNKKQRSHILSYKLIITTVHDATNDEIRELFARLQKGERLTPPELRNSMASALGDVIRAMAETHHFFNGNSFANSRYKRDDLLAHAFAIELYAGSQDLKAPNLALMYKEHQSSIDQKAVSRVNQVLGYMNKMQNEIPNCIKTKWGFVDVFWLVSKRLGNLPPPKRIATKFVKLDQLRLRHMKDPATLIAASNRKADKDLYDYIVAFSVGGSLKENLTIRQRVLAKKLLAR